MTITASELNKVQGNQSATVLPELTDGFYVGERNGQDVQVRIFGDKYYVVGNGYFWGPKVRNPQKVNQKTFLFERFKIAGGLRASTEESYLKAIDELTDVVAQREFLPMYKAVIESSKAVEVAGTSLNEHKTKVLAMKADTDFEISGINAVRSKAFGKAKKMVNEQIRENVQVVFGAKSTTKKQDHSKEKGIFALRLEDLESEFQAGKLSPILYGALKDTLEQKAREDQQKAERKAAHAAKLAEADAIIAENMAGKDAIRPMGKNMQVDLNDKEDEEEIADGGVISAEKLAEMFGSELVTEDDSKEPFEITELPKSVVINKGKGVKNPTAIEQAKQRKAKATQVA